MQDRWSLSLDPQAEYSIVSLVRLTLGDQTFTLPIRLSVSRQEIESRLRERWRAAVGTCVPSSIDAEQTLGSSLVMLHFELTSPPTQLCEATTTQPIDKAKPAE